ncbi:MAG: hypothetical protein LBD35_05940 [Prevotellaceae bacterium]|jgi:hypothetical protein|nr:hypothetical protein [Prevotellaceae bacterium]
MEGKIKSEGKCLFCDKIFAKAGINRHLKTHLDKKQNAAGLSYLVKVEQNPRWGKSPHFLSLWIDGETPLKKIDKFLRDIWLECCGHLSAFRNPDARMPYEDDDIPMSRKVNRIFHPDLKLEYEYDFGSSTELVLTVIAEYPIKADAKIVLLSRNEPPECYCQTCKKEAATQMCSVHDYDEDSMFCDKCAKKHAKVCEDFADYSSMPIVNSPRAGVCAYSGGIIDTERDGIFKK